MSVQTGGVYKYNLPTIEQVLSKKIGHSLSQNRYSVNGLGAIDDNLGWFYNDAVRSKYSNYINYVNDTYFKYEPSPSVVHPFSEPIHQLDYYFGSVTPDTQTGLYGREKGKDTLYNTYNTTKMLRQIYRGKGISYGVNDLLGLVGHLNGFDMTIDPHTGRAASFDYLYEVYRGSEYTSGNRSDYEDISAYFNIDPGYSTYTLTVGDELAQNTVDALRSNLHYGENVLADSGIGNKYLADRRYDYAFTQSLYLENVTNNPIVTTYVYKEADGADRERDDSESEVHLGRTNSYVGITEEFAGTDNIVSKTNKLFSTIDKGTMTSQYRTMISRFYNKDTESTEIQTAGTEQYGLSHGRNLLAAKPAIYNGYEDPYCRVWTHHHQYSSYDKAIRPFTDDGDVVTAEMLETTYRWDSFRVKGSGKILDENTVLHRESNTLRIAPMYNDSGEMVKDAVKRCMFSIENLAWKDNTTYLHKEQRGPLGGRIMWFPPYGLSFNENTQVQWNPNEFIGRGEKIYTYVNSERGGNIDFTLLIDHPTIVDHWSEEAAKIQQGPLDNVDSDQPILRYYAGCFVPSTDIPKPKKRKYKLKLKKEKIRELLKPTKKVVFFAFYPNNYSGQESKNVTNLLTYVDGSYVTSQVDLSKDVDFPINYLLFGAGTQDVYVTSKDDDTLYTLNPMAQTSGATVPLTYFITKNVTSPDRDLYETADFSEIFDNGNWDYSGYETCMILEQSSDTKGLSRIKQPSSAKIQGDAGTYGRKKGEQKNKDCKISTLYVNGEPINDKKPLGYCTGMLLVDTDSGDTMDAPFIFASMQEEKGGTKRNVFHRVDNYYRVSGENKGERVKWENYCDSNSFGFNITDGLNSVSSVYKTRIAEAKADGVDTIVCSLADIASVVNTDQQWMKTTTSRYTNQSTCELLDAVLNNTTDKKYIISAINVVGHASRHGHNEAGNDRNSSLSGRRAGTVLNWLKTKLADKISFAKECDAVNFNVVTGGYTLTEKSPDVNLANAKIQRSAESTISFISEENAQIYHDLISVDGKEQEFEGSDEEWEEFKRQKESQGYTVILLTDPNNLAESTDAGGYGDEYTFFKELKHEDPFVFKKLIDKIKHFDPAYHSISPEGFTERLTFLQQCCRQSATRHGGRKADNLAFGRPPVCVLRLGDFYYTKIIIENIQLNFDDTTWDMNPEGNGVQPMYVKVSIAFKFLGGSDIQGPIARLQDALSYNYYANMGMVSEYAESQVYDENGKPTSFKANRILTTKQT